MVRIDEDHLFNGLIGDFRPGPRGNTGHIVRLKPEARMCPDITGPYTGYYWPTIQADAKAYVKVCDQCQRFNNIHRQPSEYLTPMMALWPFAKWGLDILGHFPIGTRQMKFLVVGID